MILSRVHTNSCLSAWFHWEDAGEGRGGGDWEITVINYQSLPVAFACPLYCITWNNRQVRESLKRKITILWSTQYAFFQSRIYCASSVEKRTKLNFHGKRRIWDGHFIMQTIKGHRALYIFTDEVLLIKLFSVINGYSQIEGTWTNSYAASGTIDVTSNCESLRTFSLFIDFLLIHICSYLKTTFPPLWVAVYEGKITIA